MPENGSPTLRLPRFGTAQNLGNGAFAVPSFHDAAPTLSGFDVGDLNGDGWPDLIGGTQNSNAVSVFVNNGAGSLPANPSRFITTSNHRMAVAIAEVTGDSRMDVISAHGVRFCSRDLLVRNCPAAANIYTSMDKIDVGAGIRLAHLLWRRDDWWRSLHS